MVGGDTVACLFGSLKLGALPREAVGGLSSGTPNEMMSTMLDTSFLIRSGNVDGILWPFSLRLQRYIARANSGKRSCPDLVVSDNVLKT